MAFEAFSTKTSYADLNIAFAADVRFLPFLAKTCQSASGPKADGYAPVSDTQGYICKR